MLPPFDDDDVVQAPQADPVERVDEPLPTKIGLSRPW